MKKRSIAALAALGAALGAATAVGILVSKKRQLNRLGGGFGKSLPPKRNVYIAGGGLAGLSAAYYLIRDCGVPGESIHIFEESGDIGGAFNVGGDADTGFVCTAPKNLSLLNHPNLMDMLAALKSENIPDISVKDEILNFMAANPINERARIIDEDGNAVSCGFGLDKPVIKRIKTLLKMKDYEVSEVSISDFFKDVPEFFKSNFWTLISSAYMLHRGCSAAELKHIINCIASETDELFSMKNTLRAQFNLQQTVIDALKVYLDTHNVNFATHCCVTDADFDADSNRICSIHLNDNGTLKTFYLNKNDLFFVTNGSVSECATIGDYNFPAPSPEAFAASEALWMKLAEKRIGMGNPDVFYEGADSEVISFTITSKSRILYDAFCEFTGNDGIGGILTTFKASPWKLTVSTVAQPYFENQTDDVTVICGYGINTYAEGRFTDKAMRYASGAEILFELIGYMGLEDRLEEITKDVINVIPCAMPYAAASSLPYSDDEKPISVKDTNTNLAFIGQFTKLGAGISCSSEYAVRTAREAAYRLTGTKKSSAPPPKAVRGAYIKLFRSLKD